ncbi:MAG: hypothetical protein U1E27_13795 [Kiritimatiellia bacterium]|nr:hypothetical protein [Kiritimatiellia bacterium]
MGETVIGHLKKSPHVRKIVAQDIRPERVTRLQAIEGVDAPLILRAGSPR